MTILLIPGFWLTADSWAPIEARLAAAGFDVRALTLPGKAPGESPVGVGFDDHVAAVVSAVDHVPPTEPVVLVGHSGGGSIAAVAADARPDRIARVIYVDSGPVPEGMSINAELEVVDGAVPLPDWDTFGEADLRDLDENTRATFRLRAVPEPAGVARDAMKLTDERRHDIPSTVIATTMSAAETTAFIDSGHPYASEFAAATRLEIRELPTGHWPQFTKTIELADMIADIIRTDA